MDSSAQTIVQLADGRWAWVMAPGRDPTDAMKNATRAIDDLLVGPDPYLTWIGR